MSAEIENNKDEEKQEPAPKRQLWDRIVNDWLGLIFKILELILAILCVVFIFEPVETTGMGKTHLHHVGVMYTAYTGSMVIVLAILIGQLLKENLGFKTYFVFAVANSALFLTTGILLTADKSDLTKDHFFHPSRYLLNMMTTAIILTFVNAIVFAADAIISFKMRKT